LKIALRTIRAVAVVALVVSLIALFLRGVDLSRVWGEMRTADPTLGVFALTLTLVLYIVRTRRWQYLLAPLGPTRFAVAFRTTVIGFAVSAVLPARAGEVLRPLLLARKENLPATAAFATVVVERILDLVTVVLLLAIYLLFFDAGTLARAPALADAVRLGALMATVGSVGVLVVMMVCAAEPSRLHRLVLGAARVLPARLAHTLARFAQTFAEGLVVVRHPTRLLVIMALSFVLWIIIATQIWVISHAFHLAIPYTGAYLLAAILVVGVALPTPGGVGGFHEAFRIGATSFFGTDNDATVGAAIVLHAVSFVPVMIMGVWCAFAEGIDLSKLRQLSASPEETEPARSVATS
jgi:uncharacterized protein (TIRG00374 family)